MSGFRPVPGSEFSLSGQWHRVETYNRMQGFVTAVDSEGTISVHTIEDLVHHPSLTIPNQARSLIDMSGQVGEHDRQLVLLRIEETREAVTGFRSGNPDQALAGEPRPQYDPARTTKGERLRTKEAELAAPPFTTLGLKMSVSTMRRIEVAISRGQAVTHTLGKHKPRASQGRRAMHPAFEEATREVVATNTHKSSKHYRTMWREVHRALLTHYGEDGLAAMTPKPSFSTWRRWVGDHWTPSDLTGRAATRATGTSAPQGGFNRLNLTRPGELVLMDTNNLDVLLEGTALEGVVRGSLVVAIDNYSWSCPALRVVEQSETAVDIAMTFLDIGRPKQMDPRWGEEYRWPFVGLPEHVLATVGGISQVAGMPVINPEALGLDHGGPYKSEKVRDLAQRLGVDVLPARVRMGSDKAPVERFFLALRTMLLEMLDGYRGSHPGERGAQVDDEVEWTAQRLEDLITRWVILVWQTHIMDDHKPAWCPEGDWSPNDLYQHGLTTTGFVPRIMTSEDYYAALRTCPRKVQSRGIKINGLWYDDDSLLGPWRNKPAPTGSKKWTVQVDDRDLRTVWWVDVDATRHPLTWVGIQGDMPAFAKRHLKALRARVGNLERHDPQDLVLILLTQVLPLPDETGWATREGRTATADASRHNRELELVATDRSKGTRTNTQASNQGPTPTPTSPALIDIDRDPATGDHSPAATDLDIADPDVSTTSPTAAELREQQIVAARRAQRMASGADTATDAAPRLGAGRAGLLGDITGDTTEEAGGAA